MIYRFYSKEYLKGPSTREVRKTIRKGNLKSHLITILDPIL